VRCYRLVAWGVLAGVLAGAGPASAGWVIDQVVRGGGGDGRMQVLVQANRMKTVMMGPDGRPMTAVIVDLDADLVTQVDYNMRLALTGTVQEFGRTTERALQEMPARMGQAMEQMREAMKDMPPEQRQMVEQMLRAQGQQAPPGQACREPQLEVRRQGAQATIAGFPSVRYDVLADGRPESEVWIARDITAWRELDAAKLERFAGEMTRLARCSAAGGAAMGADASWKLTAEGYPTRTVNYERNMTVEVVKAESRPVPPAEFQPPPGFATKTFRDLLGP